MHDMQVIILAGGSGTRLLPLTLERPKALLPICNVSVLGRIIAQLHAAGLFKAVVSMEAPSPRVSELVQEASSPGFDLVLRTLEGPFRGQVPAVRQLMDPTAQRVLVIFGDSLLSADFAGLVAQHTAAHDRGGEATIAYHRPDDLKWAENAGRTYHGVMSVGPDQNVTQFVEKPLVKEIREGFDLANAAIFVCERNLLDRPEFETARNFSYDIFEPAVKRHDRTLYGFDIGRGWRYDIGSVARLFHANLAVLGQKLAAPLPGVLRGDRIWCSGGSSVPCRLNPPVLIGQGVHIEESAQIGPQVVLGDNCRVDKGAIVKDSVLMEGCHVGARAMLEGCLLGPHSRVGIGAILPPQSVLGAFDCVGQSDWPNWAELTR
jgi:NDP-sugar pyrophosphorylase family protein